jgi:poly(hydroxyalkanoate) granule-associated protein
VEGLLFSVLRGILRNDPQPHSLEYTMVKKLQKMSADKKSGPQLSGAVKESAQQIWLAGLGAFSKAQEEGGKVFETLVKECPHRRTQPQRAKNERQDAGSQTCCQARSQECRRQAPCSTQVGLIAERVKKKGHAVPFFTPENCRLPSRDCCKAAISPLAAVYTFLP